MIKPIFKKQTEVEVKLNVEDDKIFREILNLEKIAGFEVGSAHPGECQDVYYDTKIRLFWQNRLTLRTRKDKEGWWLFFKQEKRPPKPLYQRDEYRQRLSPKELAAFKQRKSGLALLRKIETLFGVKERDLQIALVLNNKRTNIDLKKGREEALLSLDRVLYREGQKSAFSWSIEIEARRTSQKSIKKIAQWLKKKYSLSYSYLSKYEKGLQLLEESPKIYQRKEGLNIVKKQIRQLRKKFKRLVIVGVAGGSASGKTHTIARKIYQAFPGSQVLNMDDYYKGKAFMKRIGSDNWDEPRVLDLGLLKKHLKDLKEGKKIKKPIFSFKKAERIGYESFSLPKANILIVEGIFALDEEIINQIDIKIFVQVGIHGRLLRRLMRDVKRTGQTPQSIFKMYTSIVQPMYEIYVEPTQEKASFILMNEYKPKEATTRLEEHEVQVKAPGSVTGQRLRKIGAKKIALVHQEDFFFAPPGLALWPSYELIRIRKEGENITICYKGPHTDERARIKTKMEFQIDTAMKDVLENLGYRKVMELVKNRQLWRLDHIEIALDDVKGLGKFIEVRSSRRRDQKKIYQILKSLGIDQEKVTLLSYLELIYQKKKKSTFLEEINFAEISRILASVPKNRTEKAKIGEYIGAGKIVELQRENPEIAINLAILRADYLLNQDRISGEVFRKYAIQVAEEITEATLEKEQIGPKQRKKIVIMGPWRAGLSIAGVYADKGFKNFWHIGARRNEKTLKTEIYYMAYPKVIDQTRPGNNKGIRVIITDPMLATGNTVIDSIKRLKRQGILEKNIKVNCVIAAPEGLVKILRRFPEVKIYAVAVDEKLDRKGYIVPGLGDFGDKYFDGITLKEIVDRWVKPGLLGLADLEKLFKKLEL